jgi:ParB family chromosome partitioning protein
MYEIREIETIKIRQGENQVRLELDDEDVNSLASSIRRLGLLNPITVRAEDEYFVILAGHTRFEACKSLAFTKIPCAVLLDDSVDTTEVSLAENLFRSDLSVVEVASAIKTSLDEGKVTVEEIAKGMHRSEYWVKAQVDLLTWPDDVLRVIHEGTLSVSAASNLALITDDVYRNFLLERAVLDGATARTTAAWLQAFRSQLPPQEAVQAEPVAGRDTVTGAVPQAPCLVCGEMKRTDALAYVLICPGCVAAIRNAGRSE